MLSLYSLLRLPENPVYLFQSDILGVPGTCQGSLSQYSLIFELQQPRRALSWAKAVWEPQSNICHHLEYFMAEVRKVLDARKVPENVLNYVKTPVLWRITL